VSPTIKDHRSAKDETGASKYIDIITVPQQKFIVVDGRVVLF